MKEIDFTTKTDPDPSHGSFVVGRNGTHRLAGIRFWRIPSGHIFIDGIGRSGKILNAGFFLDPVSADRFLTDLRKTEDKIKVEVCGGVAYCDDPRVEIIDHDRR